MTKEERKARRALRWKLYEACKANITLDVKLTSTPAQVRYHARVLADQILAGKNPHIVQVIIDEKAPGFDPIPGLARSGRY